MKEEEWKAERRQDLRSNVLALVAVVCLLAIVPVLLGVFWKFTNLTSSNGSGGIGIALRPMGGVQGGDAMTSGKVSAAGGFRCVNGSCDDALITVAVKGGTAAGATVATAPMPLKSVPVTPQSRGTLQGENVVAFQGQVPPSTAPYVNVEVTCTSKKPVEVNVMLSQGTKRYADAAVMTCP